MSPGDGDETLRRVLQTGSRPFDESRLRRDRTLVLVAIEFWPRTDGQHSHATRRAETARVKVLESEPLPQAYNPVASHRKPLRIARHRKAWA